MTVLRENIAEDITLLSSALGALVFNHAPHPKQCQKEKTMSLDSKCTETMANGNQANVFLSLHSTYTYWGPKRGPKLIPETGDSKEKTGASLVAQWLGVCLLMQGTRVRALVWEDPTCRGATGPVSHDY